MKYELRYKRAYRQDEKGGSSENDYKAIEIIQKRDSWGLNQCGGADMICSLTVGG